MSAPVKRPESLGLSRAAVLVAGVACASVVVSHIFGRSTYSLLLPAISEELVSSYTAAGFLGMSYFAGYMIGVVLVTLVSSRIEPIVLLRTGLGLSALALAVLATAPEFSILATGIFFAGFAGAAIWVPAPTIATSLVPERHRGLVMGALTASMGIALLLVSQGTTVYRNAVGNDDAWRPIFGVEAVVAFGVLLAALTLLKVTRAPQDNVDEERPPLFSTEALRSMPQWKLLFVSYTAFALLAGAWTQFLGVAMKQDGGFGPAHINNLYSVLAVAAIPGPLLLGRLSDRIGRDRALAIAAGLAAAGSLLVTVAREPFATIATALFGIGSFSVPTLTATAVRDHLDGRVFAAAFGAMTIVYGFASLLSAQTAGVLADATGSFRLVYILLAVAAMITATAALRRHSSS